MTDALILSGARTPVGKLLGVLKDFSAVDLGVIAARLHRACGDRSDSSRFIMGNVVQAGTDKPSRQVACEP